MNMQSRGLKARRIREAGVRARSSAKPSIAPRADFHAAKDYGHDYGRIGAFSRSASLRAGAESSVVLSSARTVLQRKAVVDTPGDALEREADTVADKVIGMTVPESSAEFSGTSQEERQTGNTQPRLFQRRSAAGAHGSASISGDAAVDVTARSGASLPTDVRAYFEARFHHDFSKVRVHDGDEAARAAVGIEARAYTLGSNIVFGAGQYAPSALAGKRLLAHELAHVVQQTGSPFDGAGSRLSAPGRIQRAARFEDDPKLEDVKTGADKVGPKARGMTVTKLQQALIDLGYTLPGGVDGKFEGQTKTALLKFQKDRVIPESGELDTATLVELNKVFDTRKPYIDKAKLDPLKPATRALSATDKTAAVAALVPAPQAGAPSTFTEDLGPPKGKYGDRIKARLAALIPAFHKDLFEDKKPLRADPAKNFHTTSALEAPAQAAKDVVDKVYDSNYGGAAAKPAMTFLGGNLIDQWTDEIATNKGLTPAQQKDKAEGKVRYLIDSNCEAINGEHSAVPSAATESAILTPIIKGFVSSTAQVQTMLELDIGWEGAQLEGKVYLQRYKSTDANVPKAKEANRVQMWTLFHTCIHEYLHTLADGKFNTWANGFRLAGDNTRYNTLTEGFCDFFTMNVRTTVAPLAVQAAVEGPYANGNPPPVVSPAVYASFRQAEQVISVVGIKNAQAAYFQGKTDLMGSP